MKNMRNTMILFLSKGYFGLLVCSIAVGGGMRSSSKAWQPKGTIRAEAAHDFLRWEYVYGDRKIEPREWRLLVEDIFADGIKEESPVAQSRILVAPRAMFIPKLHDSYLKVLSQAADIRSAEAKSILGCIFGKGTNYNDLCESIIASGGTKKVHDSNGASLRMWDLVRTKGMTPDVLQAFLVSNPHLVPDAIAVLRYYERNNIYVPALGELLSEGVMPMESIEQFVQLCYFMSPSEGRKCLAEIRRRAPSEKRKGQTVYKISDGPWREVLRETTRQESLLELRERYRESNGNNSIFSFMKSQTFGPVGEREKGWLLARHHNKLIFPLLDYYLSSSKPSVYDSDELKGVLTAALQYARKLELGKQAQAEKKIRQCALRNKNKTQAINGLLLLENFVDKQDVPGILRRMSDKRQSTWYEHDGKVEHTGPLLAFSAARCIFNLNSDMQAELQSFLRDGDADDQVLAYIKKRLSQRRNKRVTDTRRGRPAAAVQSRESASKDPENNSHDSESKIPPEKEKDKPIEKGEDNPE